MLSLVSGSWSQDQGWNIKKQRKQSYTTITHRGGAMTTRRERGDKCRRVCSSNRARLRRSRGMSRVVLGFPRDMPVVATSWHQTLTSCLGTQTRVSNGSGRCLFNDTTWVIPAADAWGADVVLRMWKAIHFQLVVSIATSTRNESILFAPGLRRRLRSPAVGRSTTQESRHTVKRR